MASPIEDKPKKAGLWAILTCKVCQVDDHTHFTEIDDSVHRILKDDDNGKLLEKKKRLTQINREAKEEQEKQKAEIEAAERNESAESGPTS
jgi:hypothetical protein